MIAFDDPLLIGGDAELLERSNKCGKTRLSGVQFCRSADEGDVAMSEGCQMLHTLTYAMAVVDLEEADAGALRAYIDKDERYFAFG